MLQFVNKLHQEGLLDKEIFTIEGGALNAKGQEGLLGATIVPNPEMVMGRKEYIGLGALKDRTETSSIPTSKCRWFM